MSGWIVVGLILILAGAAMGAPGVLLVGGLTLLSRWLTTLWSRIGLDRVAFSRRLGSDRAVWGDEVALDVEIWNRKVLPLPLISADDHVTDTLRVAGHRLGPSERPGRATLTSSWSLLWFERVVRHLRIEAVRRGLFEFGPVRLTVSDLFERGSAREERDLPAQLLVRPRTVPVRDEEPARAPLGTTRTASSLFSDPARYAGVRPYQPGDPLRRVHWRATARSRAPVSRRYEPVHERQVLLAIDLQTVPGPHWLMVYDDDSVESLCVGAASIARRLLARGASCGLLLGVQLAGGRRWAYLAPSASPGQLGRIEDLLARVQPIVSLPFEDLLPVVPRLLAPGGSVTILGAREPSPYLDPMRRLARSGYGIRWIGFGADAGAWAERLRPLGVDGRTATLDPSWRDADALLLAR